MLDQTVNSYGPFALLQLLGALIVLGGVAFAVLRGSRDRRTSSNDPPPEQRLFFDGPINVIIALLRDIRESSRSIERHVDPLGELQRNQNREIVDIKRQIEDIKNIKRGR